MAQLPLELKLKPHASFDSFVAGPNTIAISHLRSVAAGQRSDSVWIYGPPGSGKSHLLAATCRAASEAGARPMYFSLGSVEDPAALSQLEELDLISLDDVESVAGKPEWEACLFQIFNDRLQRGGLVAASRKPPRDLDFGLPDLVSRASAAAVYQLDYLSDRDLLEAVLTHASMRGLEFEPAVGTYLLERYSRDLVALTRCLDRIDRVSLAAQRRITIPLLREIINP